MSWLMPVVHGYALFVVGASIGMFLMMAFARNPNGLAEKRCAMWMKFDHGESFHRVESVVNAAIRIYVVVTLLKLWHWL